MVAPPESAHICSSNLQVALRVLAGGGVIAYPTEAVYGLGCMPGCEFAVQRVRAIKRRRRGKGLILVAAEFDQVRFLVDISGIEMRHVLGSWPGPVTWVFPAGRQAPRWLLGDDASLAIRVSAHPVVRALCGKAGPLISTSANPHGLPPARTALRTRSYFGRAVDLVVPGQVGGNPGPTEIRSARLGNVIRKGG